MEFKIAIYPMEKPQCQRHSNIDMVCCTLEATHVLEQDGEFYGHYCKFHAKEMAMELVSEAVNESPISD